MKFFGLILVVAAFFVFVTISAMANNTSSRETYQGRSITWWAHHTVQARKEANAQAVTIRFLKTKLAQDHKTAVIRSATIKRLKTSITHDPTIEECVRLATIAYPSFSESRAWLIIKHESWTSGKQFAKNPSSTASGLYQFLTSTFASTPYGQAGMSIWSPCATSLAAGWMHENGRGGEWAYG